MVLLTDMIEAQNRSTISATIIHLSTGTIAIFVIVFLNFLSQLCLDDNGFVLCSCEVIVFCEDALPSMHIGLLQFEDKNSMVTIWNYLHCSGRIFGLKVRKVLENQKFLEITSRTVQQEANLSTTVDPCNGVLWRKNFLLVRTCPAQC